MTTLLFPVGHYLGPHYLARADQPAGHRVRVGASLRWLGTEPEVLAWTLAHGPGELGDPDQAWDRANVLAYGRWLAGTDLTDAVTRLVDRRLLVEVDPDGAGAAGFALAHRLRSLMLPLGPDPDDPDSVLLGTAGQPELALSELGHAVWRAGSRTGTLWDACQAVAGGDAGQPAAGSGGAAPPAAGLLSELLSELHDLLSAGAAYLDAAEGGSDAGVEIH